MSATSKQLLARRRRHVSLRKRVTGSAAQPRLAVFRSTKHITAQIIDDVSGRTLAAASTTEKDLRSGATGNIEAAKTIGTRLAERATKAGITKVVFDRGGFLYHGRVAAVAEAARAKGLEF